MINPQKTQQEEEQPKLYIQVQRVRHLPRSPRNGKTKDPKISTIFCEMAIEKNKLETSHKPLTSPFWNEEFLFLVTKKRSTILLKVFQSSPNNQKKQYLLGSLKIRIESLLNEQPIERWFQLNLSSRSKSKSLNTKQQKRRKTEIKLKIHFTFSGKHLIEAEKEVQLRKQFKRIVQPLCSKSSLILTTYTDVIHTGDSDKVAQTFVSVLNNYGVLLDFLKTTIRREVEKTKTSQQLFRTDSMITKMMSHLKTNEVMSWVSSTIRKPILTIFKTKTIITLKPDNITKEELKNNFKWYKGILQEIFENIFNSVDIVPDLCQKICSYLFSSVKDKFPEHAYMSVSGFIFLRLICPAITNPSSFIFRTEALSTPILKNLVMVAKIIQTIANYSKVGVKDHALIPFEDWANKKRKQLNEFISKISVTEENKKETKSIKNIKKSKHVAPIPDILEFYNILKKYYHEVSTIMKIEKTKQPQKEESISLFLQAKDPLTQLAINLSRFKPPKEPIAKKLHNISNSEIKKYKALHITNRNRGSYFLIDDEDDPYVLNQGLLYNDSEPRSANKVSEEVLSTFRNLWKENQSSINNVLLEKSKLVELINFGSDDEINFIDDEDETDDEKEKNSLKEKEKVKTKNGIENNKEQEQEQGQGKEQEQGQGQKQEQEQEQEQLNNNPKNENKNKNEQKKDNKLNKGITEILKLKKSISSQIKRKKKLILARKVSKGGHDPQNLIVQQVGWKQIKKSSKYIEYIRTLGELNKVSLESLNHSQKVAFWINIYNALILHASIDNKGSPPTFWHLKRVNSGYKYLIGGLKYSRDDILQGILKGNNKYFSRDDPRQKSVLTGNFIPYILFALSDLQITSPTIFVYDPINIDKQLLYACKCYLERFVKSDPIIEETTKLIIPTLFKWNKNIFSSSDKKVFNFILSSLLILNPSKYHKLLELTKLDYEIQYDDIFPMKDHPKDPNLDDLIFNKSNLPIPDYEHLFSFSGNPRTHRSFKK
ncbi:ras gtpase-activating protein [Anaeramoeba flamelloides]|uniref:Ras gtpase-activating protein n=1 Tax=Anaeramoeba flamelloides TaxID=1746091 RepID=A0ABQ8YHS9_9EUKA|nr:ras gtpase-activating protein [Anaeramoeba flamelloides]